MKETQNKRKLTEIDTLRGIFCLFVLLIHITATPSMSLKVMSFSSILYSVLNIATKVAVPGFIFISGLTLCYGYRNVEKINIPKFYFKRFRNVVIPYIIYTVLYYVVYIKNYNYEVSWDFFLTNLINGTMVYHLYYIVIIIQFYLLFPLIHWLFKKSDQGLLLVISIVINLFIIGHVNNSTFFALYLMFFMLGAYIGFNYEEIENIINKNNSKKSILIAGIIVTVLYIIEQYSNRHFGTAIFDNSWHIFSLVAIIFYLTISKMINDSNKKWINKIKNTIVDISKVSFSIYLIHPLVLLYLENNFNNFAIEYKYIIVGVSLIGLAFIYSKICKILKIKK